MDFSYNTLGIPRKLLLNYLNIDYLFDVCCIAEFTCNKMRSSEINLCYSGMQLEPSEVDLKYLKSIWKILKLIWIICNTALEISEIPRYSFDDR